MEYRINESEYRFMDILWEKEPVSSTELVGLCSDRLGWKKSTTYTVIKNLSRKQVVLSREAMVTALVKREQIQRQESGEFLDKKFKGSLPAFVAAFLQDRKLSEQDAQRLEEMIRTAVDK